MSDPKLTAGNSDHMNRPQKRANRHQPIQKPAPPTKEALIINYQI